MLILNKKILKKYFVIYRLGKPSQNTLDLADKLEQYGFSIINLGDLLSTFDPAKMVIPIDRHPSSEAYWILSEVIKNNIETIKYHQKE